MKLLDTSAWIEFFQGSALGKEVEKVLKEEQAYTCAITLAEVAKWVQDNKGDVVFAIGQIKENSIIIPLEESILVESGLQYTPLRARNGKIGMIDVIIYVAALLHGLELVTKDPDFKRLPFVRMLK